MKLLKQDLISLDHQTIVRFISPFSQRGESGDEGAAEGHRGVGGEKTSIYK